MTSSAQCNLHLLPCHATDATVTIPAISAVTTSQEIEAIVDIRATPGGGKQKNLSKKKLKKFFSGPAGSSYVWDKTLSNRRTTDGMSNEVLTSHAIRALGNASNVLILLDRFDVIRRLCEANDGRYSVSVVQFPDANDVFSIQERPFDPQNTDVDLRGSRRRPSVDEKNNESDVSQLPKALRAGAGPQLTDVPRFTLGEDFETAGRAYLEENGYVVIRSVMDAQEIAHAENLLWNHLENLGSGIRRDDVSTWNNDNWPDRQPSGVVAWEGIGQSPFVWFVRGRPNVRRVFEQALQSDALITSFDGCGLFRPWQYDREWLTKKSWIHIDQNPAFSPNFECLQGLITLKDANESTGGFMCIPRTHKEMLNFYERHRNGSKRMQKIFSRPDQMLVRLPENDPLMEWTKIIPRMFAGDMILWDSRTMHCNSHAVDMSVSDDVYNREVNEWDLIRIVAYVCMSVPSMITTKGGDLETVLRQREHAARNQITTNHMPFIYKPNGDAPPRKGNKSTLRTPPWPRGFELSEDQWRLVRGV